MTDVTEAGLTIDELARRTGMTVRNIRAHQSRGLLPPPEVRGRTGYYDDEHVARIELIKEMQADGFNLGSIRRLLERVDGASAEMLDFARAVRAPFEEEQPEIVDAAGLAERFGQGEEPNPALIERAVKLGILRPLGGDRFEIRSPLLQKAGAELAALGVPPETGLEIAAKLRRHSSAVAREFVELFIEHVWKPFDEAGRPEEQWPEVRATLDRLRPLASEALLAVFQMVMSEATEEAFGRVLEREVREESRTHGGGRRRRRSRTRSRRS